MYKVSALDKVARTATPQIFSFGQTKSQFPHLYNGIDNSASLVLYLIHHGDYIMC